MAANTGSELAIDRYSFYVRYHASVEDRERASRVVAHLRGLGGALEAPRPDMEKLQMALSQNKTCGAAVVTRGR